MNRFIFGVILAVVLPFHVAYAKGSDLKRTRVQFEEMAMRLPYLARGAVLYDRPENFGGGVDIEEEWQEHSRVLARATNGSYSKDALLALLRHREPKVRTLAAVALFDSEDPMVLPELVKLCRDESPTFDGHPKLSKAWYEHASVGPPPTAQSVGGLVRGMVEFYMERSGIYSAAEPGDDDFEKRFAAYWSVRRSRDYNADWFSVWLARASRGQSPISADCIERIRMARRRIDKLPEGDRAWVLLRLNGETGSEELVSEAELVEACRKLGPEKLLKMLENNIPSDDPSLQPHENNNYPYERAARFVLTHAKLCFRPEDSGALLALERWHYENKVPGAPAPIITSGWAIAAAQLNPSAAPDILKAALARFDGPSDEYERVPICVAMWQLAGRTEIGFVLDCLFSEEPTASLDGANWVLFNSLKDDPNAKEFVALLIRDSRFDSLDWGALEHLIRVVNEWNASPVVTEDELREAWHPLGTDHFRRSKQQAEQEFPKETADLLARLTEWRECLRRSLPQWYYSGPLNKTGETDLTK